MFTPLINAEALPPNRLEKCALEMAGSREGEKLSEETSWFVGYQNGFLGALHLQVFVSPGNEPPAFKHQATEAMRSPHEAAKSLHQFILKYKPVGFQSNAEQDALVMTAWYLWNCKGSDGGAKMKSVVALHAAYGFSPAVDELGKEAIREVMLEKGPQILETLQEGIDQFEKAPPAAGPTPP